MAKKPSNTDFLTLNISVQQSFVHNSSQCKVFSNFVFPESPLSICNFIYCHNLKNFWGLYIVARKSMEGPRGMQNKKKICSNFLYNANDELRGPDKLIFQHCLKMLNFVSADWLISFCNICIFCTFHKRFAGSFDKRIFCCKAVLNSIHPCIKCLLPAQFKIEQIVMAHMKGLLITYEMTYDLGEQLLWILRN